ncbi:hypothetical protein HQQ81_21205 [Microbacteriaceae bacterium VKM Ac-2854]|nr:hypothetical protein [Microbacteriaceae bacterium VKM Ac-2854]
MSNGANQAPTKVAGGYMVSVPAGTTTICYRIGGGGGGSDTGTIGGYGGDGGSGALITGSIPANMVGSTFQVIIASGGQGSEYANAAGSSLDYGGSGYTTGGDGGFFAAGGGGSSAILTTGGSPLVVAAGGGGGGGKGGNPPGQDIGYSGAHGATADALIPNGPGGTGVITRDISGTVPATMSTPGGASAVYAADGGNGQSVGYSTTTQINVGFFLPDPNPTTKQPGWGFLSPFTNGATGPGGGAMGGGGGGGGGGYQNGGLAGSATANGWNGNVNTAAEVFGGGAGAGQSYVATGIGGGFDPAGAGNGGYAPTSGGVSNPAVPTSRGGDGFATFTFYQGSDCAC